MVEGDRSIRDLSDLARHVTYWTIAWAIIQIGLSCFSFLELQELRKWPATEPIDWLTPTLSPDLEMYAGLTALIYLVMFVVSGVLALRWIYLANRNAQRLSGGLDVSPGWNVGWFFVPIATWFKPFQGVDQTWRASHEPDHWRDGETPSLLRWWWGLWLATSITGTISFRLDFSSDTVARAIAADWFDIASSILAIPAAYFFIKVVAQLTDTQRKFATTEGERLASHTG